VARVHSLKSQMSFRWWLRQRNTGSFCLTIAKLARVLPHFSAETLGYLRQVPFKLWFRRRRTTTQTWFSTRRPCIRHTRARIDTRSASTCLARLQTRFILARIAESAKRHQMQSKEFASPIQWGTAWLGTAKDSTFWLADFYKFYQKKNPFTCFVKS
jgi:hypothetical protein